LISEFASPPNYCGGAAGGYIESFDHQKCTSISCHLAREVD
jgi:hypothetical protein